MFRSVFVRLIITYFFIIIITLVVLGLLLTQMFKHNYMEERRTELRQEAIEISRLGEESALGMISEETLYVGLRATARQLKAAIWIVDRFGFVWRVADPNQETQWEGQQFTKEEFSQYMKQILDGHTIESWGNFGKRFQTPVLTVGSPFIVNNRIIGAIFIHTQLEEIQRVYYSLYSQLWRSAILSGILAITLISWISVRISSPLIEMNMIALEIAKGNFNRKVKVKSRDEIGQLAKSFNSMADDLKSLEDLRKSFVANVSHELRSPLTSMQGFIQGMLDGTIPKEENPRYLAIVLDETKRLNKLINELLDVARIESGRFPLNWDKFDINELIRRVLIRYEGKINEKELEVEVIFRDDHFTVTADKDRIEQVVTNLIDNAIKFSSHGGKISIWTHDDAKEHVFVSISDSGEGIPQEDIPFIWERFYKADKSHSSESTGTGLGLHIAKKIIEQHGQRIWVKSQYGKGTVFIFSLKKIEHRK